MYKQLGLFFLAITIGVGVLGGFKSQPAAAGFYNPLVPFIRLYNPAINDHFYTNSDQEALDAQTKYGYRLEGTMGYLYSNSQDNTEAVYRLWNPSAGKHFYTTNSTEADGAVRGGFTREGVVGYMPNNGGIHVNRLYNPKLHKHFFTTSISEVLVLSQAGYAQEGYLGGGLFATNAAVSNLFEMTTSSTLPAGTIGQYYSAPIRIVYNGTSNQSQNFITYSFRNLPEGFNWPYGQMQGDVMVTGLPKAACKCTIYLDVSDAIGNSTTFSLYLSINPAVNTSLNIVTDSLPGAIIGQPYTAQLTATGGVAPYTWTFVNTNYPSACCVLGFGSDGKFTTQSSQTVLGPAGTYSWLVEVTDGLKNKASKTVYLTINSAVVSAPLNIVTNSLPDATVGQPYSTQLQATGGVAPYTWSTVYTNYPTGCCVLGLNGPDGATFNTQTSSVVPAPAGNYFWTVLVTDAVGNRLSKSIFLTIRSSSSLLITSPATLPNGTPDAPTRYKFVVTGGVAPYQWREITSDYPYLLGSRQAAFGFIAPYDGSVEVFQATNSSYYTQPGTWHSTIQVTDAVGNLTTQNVTFTVLANNPPPQATYNAAADYASATVLTPNGGEVLQRGQTYRITWQSSKLFERARIYSSACSSCLDVIAMDIPNIGYYDWNVSVGQTSNTQFRLAVDLYTPGAPGVVDYSDRTFTVLP